MKYFHFISFVIIIFSCSCDKNDDYKFFDLTKNQIDILFVSRTEGIPEIFTIVDTVPKNYYIITLPKGIESDGFIDPAWSNNPRKFALSNFEEMIQLPYVPYQTNIYIVNMDIDSFPYSQITQDHYKVDSSNGVITAVLNLSPDWSLDGRSLIYISNRTERYEIYRVYLDNFSRPISSHMPLTDSTDSIDAYCYPAFSPDGTKILYTSKRTGHEEIWMMDTIGSFSSKIMITQTNATQTRRPRFSPDGNTIAFYSNLWINGIDSLQIYTIKPNGTELDTVTMTGNCFDPYWKYDGEKIVYAKSSIPGRSYIYIIDRNGDNESKLINDSKSSYPVWRPR